MNRRQFVASASALAAWPLSASTNPSLIVATPMAPPEWALLQRELLRVQTEACEAFYARYFDERGYLRAVERWGANDGPDDAIEHLNDWALLHALGGSDRILELYRKAWEGHLQQYSRVRTKQVELGRRGMYVREFPPQMDWQHISEGLTTFNLMGLSTPQDPKLIERARRFAGFYTGEDQSAPNYDRERRIIRSVFNGSAGPLLRPATALDWAGDPFDVSKFKMEHGERTYEETLAHYRDYTDVVGDNPLNLHATTLALNAFMLTGDRKYRTWALEYLDAWVERAEANGGILPSIVGLDGRIGGPAGKWYGGVYGWGFSPIVPQTGEREDRNRVPRAIVAFMNASLLTGDDRYMQLWRRQNEVINQQARTIDGKLHTPRMYGEQGWYSYAPGPYRTNAFEIWYVSMRASDRELAGDHPWIAFLEGRNAAYPIDAQRQALIRVRERIAAMQADTSTPETRLADNAINFNPASVTALIQLTQGGLHIARPPWSSTSPHQGGAPLHCRLRYFDRERRRAGLPSDVAALVDELGADRTSVTLVNLNPASSRTITVQGGAYAEHRIESATLDGRRVAIDDSAFDLELRPGCGARLQLNMRRYANAPTLAFPWLR
ncbi:hypothetical protein GCM10011487_16140 [Steroidobacter agaridevorans]|uniref:Uncharacterized protein n=1 Tax=Steroidobacter agaridevorans TaxID=2695856 RepID=A0A829Y8J4_9GAMM|nr:hypothetical protein [Steroidobacter agaridevorans]GFE79614.1 hypothetical protein GCM10011487_16140 [Steroidobacter agaridevorans]